VAKGPCVIKVEIITKRLGVFAENLTVNKSRVL
jgi:hypothetical protein